MDAFKLAKHMSHLVMCLQKLHIISYDRSQIKVSAGVDEEMTRLHLSQVPPAPSWSIAENTTDCVKLLHLNVGSLLKNILISTHMGYISMLTLYHLMKRAWHLKVSLNWLILG